MDKKKYILICGAYSELAKGVAIGLSKLNYNLILLGKNSKKLSSLKKKIKSKTITITIDLADEKPDGSQCNFADKNASADWANAEVDDGYATCSAVGSYPANGYGLYDMVGNVYEWCADWWDPDYYSQSPAKNPAGPDTGSSRLLRGGAWRNGARALRVANRLYDFPNNRDVNRGFRCVVSGSDNP